MIKRNIYKKNNTVDIEIIQIFNILTIISIFIIKFNNICNQQITNY